MFSTFIRRSLFAGAVLVVGTGVLVPLAAPAAPIANPLGTVKVTPTSKTVGAVTTVTITYKADTHTPFKGALRVDVPFGFSAPQTANALAPSYLALAAKSCAAASIASVAPLAAGGNRITMNLDCAKGKSARLKWTAATVSSTAGAYTFTSTAALAPGSTFTALAPQPTFTAKPASASQLVVDAPAQAVLGQPFSFTVTARDAFGNVATTFRKRVHTAASAGLTSLPTDYVFTSHDNGVHTFVNGATATDVGDRVITVATIGAHPITGSDTLSVHDPADATFAITPNGATLPLGQAQTYVAKQNGADVTSASTFTMTDGNCFAANCTATSAGPHLVTATRADFIASTIEYATAPCDETWAHPGTSGSWTDAASWSPPAVPTQTTSVCLPDGAYTVGVTAFVNATTLMIGHGVTLAAVSGSQQPVFISALGVTDHGTISLDASAGGVLVMGSTNLAIASDGALGNAGGVNLTANVMNAGAVTITDMLQYGCQTNCPERWTNLAGSTTTVQGLWLVGTKSQTVDQQAGANLTVSGIAAIAANSYDNNSPTFIDDGGTISGTVYVANANLALHRGTTGTFGLQNTTAVNGTVGTSQVLLVDNGPAVLGSSTPPTVITQGLTNNGFVAFGGTGTADESLVGDVTNTSAGHVEVNSGTAAIVGDIDNQGSLIVRSGAGLLMRCHQTSCAASTLENGGNVTVDGSLLLNSKNVSFIQGALAALTVDSASNGRMLVDSPGDSSATFVDNGGTITGAVDLGLAQLTLNAGTTGEFDLHNFTFVTGSLAHGQTIVLAGGVDRFDAHHAQVTMSLPVPPFTVHGAVVLTSHTETGIATISGAFTVASDGLLEADAGAGGSRALTTVTNHGELRVEPATTMIVTGTYTSSATATLTTQVASAASFGQLSVTGATTLAGALHVALVGGYTPHASDHLQIVAGPRSGSQFATTTLAGYTVSYSDPNAVFLNK